MNKEKIMPESAYETIGVEKARLFLEKNRHNRPFNELNCRFFINQMNNNEFTDTGESIKFDVNGDLIDGQHRLTAIMRTGKPQMMLVVRNLSVNAFRHIDTGRKRVASDVLGIEGIVNPTKIATMAKFIIIFQRGKYDIAEFTLSNKLSLYDSYKAGCNKHNKLLPTTLLGSFHYIFKQIDEPMAEDWVHKMSTGDDCPVGHPVRTLRDHLIYDLRSRRKMPPLQKNAFICKSWNLYRTKKTCKKYDWNSTNDPFPKPI